jgi:hypothetical protein
MHLLENPMLRRLFWNPLIWFALVALAFGSVVSAQRTLTVTGIHQDEAGPLPADMRLGLFAVQGGVASSEEIGSTRMIAGTFEFLLPAELTDERFLRPLVSGSFPLAFMIGNEFVVDRAGVNFISGVLHPYQDRCGSEGFDNLRDTRYASTIPELPNFGGFFNLVYVSQDVVLRTTPFEFRLRQGWNAVLSRFEGNRMLYEVVSDLDINLLTYGPSIPAQDPLPCP